MNLRAEQSVFWPGITKDISTVRERCYTCHKNAPSQAKLPPVDPIVPQYPFEHICMDYMSLHGNNYGVFVDRFTGWPGVYTGSAASDVVSVLSNICEDYGSRYKRRSPEQILGAVWCRGAVVPVKILYISTILHVLHHF